MTNDASNSVRELEICWQLAPVEPPHEQRQRGRVRHLLIAVRARVVRRRVTP